MRLFLSSQDFGNYPEVLLKMVGANKKVAFIANAQDDNPEYRDASLQTKLDEFISISLEPENVDLRDYFGKSSELEKKLEAYGLVWARGGNTFVLRRAMAASGFDKIIKEKLEKDELVYGGSSAGACVAAENLQGVDIGDRPTADAVPPEYPIKETIWEGLGLVSFVVVPHCDTDWFGEYAKGSVEKLKKLGLKYKALNDGQVVVVDGEKTEFLK